MRTLKKILFIIPLILLFVFSLTSCIETVVDVVSLSVKEGAPEEMLAGEIDYEKFTLVLTYSDDSVEEVQATRDMIDNNSWIACFNNIGEQTIIFSYKGVSCEYKIAVKKYTFGDIYLVDEEITYDGKPHSLTLMNCPSDVDVTYPKGSTFTNAGVHEVVCRLESSLYVTKEITGTLIINEAELNLDIEFNDKTTTYNEEAQSISVTGLEGYEDVIKVTYMIDQAETNSKIDAGVYSVTAIFDTGINYKKIDKMTATLTINKADYAINKELYPFTIEPVEFDKEIEVHIKNENNLPKGVTVSYSGYDTYEAGTYTVTASFVGDTKNHNLIEPITTTLVRLKKTLSMDGVKLPTKSVVYGTVTNNSKYQTLEVTGKIPDAYELDPNGFEYFDEDGNIIESASALGGVKDVGTYTVVAHFVVKEGYKNDFEAPQPISGILEITKRKIIIERKLEVYEDMIKASKDPKDPNYNEYSNATIIYLPNEKVYEYTGSIPVFTVDNLPQGMYVELSSSISKNPGTYSGLSCKIKYTYETIEGSEAPLLDDNEEIVLDKLGQSAKNNYQELSDKYDNITIIINKIHIDTNFPDLEYKWSEADNSEYDITTSFLKDKTWPSWLEPVFYNSDMSLYTSNPTVPNTEGLGYQIIVKFRINDIDKYNQEKNLYELEVDDSYNVITDARGYVIVLYETINPQFKNVASLSDGAVHKVELDKTNLPLTLPGSIEFGINTQYKNGNDGSVYNGKSNEGIHKIFAKVTLDDETIKYYKIAITSINKDGETETKYYNSYEYEIYQTIYSSNKELFEIDYYDSTFTYDGSIKTLNFTKSDAVEYSVPDDGRTEPGTYQISVYFKFKSTPLGQAYANYYKISPNTPIVNGYYLVTKKITINKANYDIKFNDGPFEYEYGINRTLQVSNTESWKENTDFTYQVTSYYKLNGSNWESVLDTELITPGQYKASVKTTIIDNTKKSRYISADRDIMFAINKQKLNIYAEDNTYIYDGQIHKVRLINAPADFILSDEGNGQILPGEYQVKFKFVKNHPLYQDEDDRVVILKIKTVDVEVETLLQFLSNKVKTVKQFTTLNDLLSGTVSLSKVDTGFSFDNYEINNLSLDYYDGDTPYSDIYTSRHYSATSYTSNDAVFNNYTKNNDRVIVVFDLKLKDGRVPTDDDLGVFNETRTIRYSLEVYVEASELIDVSFLRSSFLDEATVNENVSLKSILFNTNTFVNKTVNYSYSVKYYVNENELYDHNLFKECFKDTTTNIDYIFSVPTFKDRYALVTYKLFSNGYGFDDGFESMKEYTRTVKVHVNPTYSIDFTSIEDALFVDDNNYSFNTDEYTDFVDTISNYFDKDNCNVDLVITKNNISNVGNNLLDEYIFKDSGIYNALLTATPKNGLEFSMFVIEGEDVVRKTFNSYSRSFTINVSYKNTINKSDLKSKFESISKIYQFDEIYNEHLTGSINNLPQYINVDSIEVIDQLGVAHKTDLSTYKLSYISDNENKVKIKVRLSSNSNEYVFIDDTTSLTVPYYEFEVVKSITNRNQIDLEDLLEDINESNYTSVNQYDLLNNKYPSSLDSILSSYNNIIEYSIDTYWGKTDMEDPSKFISISQEKENVLKEVSNKSFKSTSLESGYKTLYKIDFKFNLKNSNNKDYYFEENSLTNKTVSLFIYSDGYITNDTDITTFNNISTHTITNPIEIKQYSDISNVLLGKITNTQIRKENTKITLVDLENKALEESVSVLGDNTYRMSEYNSNNLYKVTITYKYVDDNLGNRYGIVIDDNLYQTYDLTFYVKVNQISTKSYDNFKSNSYTDKISVYLYESLDTIRTEADKLFDLGDFSSNVNVIYDIFLTDNGTYSSSDSKVNLNNKNGGNTYTDIFNVLGVSVSDVSSKKPVLRVKIQLKNIDNDDYLFIDNNNDVVENGTFTYNINVEFKNMEIISLDTFNSYWNDSTAIMYQKDKIIDYLLFGLDSTKVFVKDVKYSYKTNETLEPSESTVIVTVKDYNSLLFTECSYIKRAKVDVLNLSHWVSDYCFEFTLNDLVLVTADHCCFGIDQNNNPIYEKTIFNSDQLNTCTKKVYAPIDLDISNNLKEATGYYAYNGVTYGSENKFETWVDTAFLYQYFGDVDYKWVCQFKGNKYSYDTLKNLEDSEISGTDSSQFMIDTQYYEYNKTIHVKGTDNSYRITINLVLEDGYTNSTFKTNYTIRKGFEDESPTYKVRNSFIFIFVATIVD